MLYSPVISSIRSLYSWDCSKTLQHNLIQVTMKSLPQNSFSHHYSFDLTHILRICFSMFADIIPVANVFHKSIQSTWRWQLMPLPYIIHCGREKRWTCQVKRIWPWWFKPKTPKWSNRPTQREIIDDFICAQNERTTHSNGTTSNDHIHTHPFNSQFQLNWINQLKQKTKEKIKYKNTTTI